MAERYIQRAILPAQRFDFACPVVLLAGALLEDTQQPRLVGQLKWLAPKKMVTALTLTLHCQEGATAELVFRYEDLHTIPGQPFGQYVAIPLPAGTTAFQVQVEEVSLQNGTVWNRQAEQTNRQAAQQTAAQAAAQKAQAVQAKAESLSDPATPRKPVSRKVLAAAAALAAVILIAILLPKSGDKKDQTPPAQDNTPVAADDTAGETFPAQDSTPAAADDTAGTKAFPAQDSTPAAADDTAAPSASPSPIFSSIDLGETGDIATISIHRGENGYFSLTPDAFVDYIPNATTTCTWMGKDLGGDVIAYLKDSFSFAHYVCQDSPSHGIPGDGTMYPSSQDKVPPTVCVLALNGQNNGSLVGYFIGQPQQVDEDTIRIDITLCDYRLTFLYEQERATFLEDQELLDLPQIPPDADFKSLAQALGVEYCIQGFYTGNTANLADDDCQRYHLWQELHSPDVWRYARSLESLLTRMEKNGPQGKYMFHLLLDQNCNPIAYTWQH